MHKKKSTKFIDGLKRKKRNIKKKKKPLRVVLIIAGVFLIIAGILFLMPSTRAKIGLARMLWSGKYLVLFQNNAELRPTGGFIGSFAVIDMKYGRIKNIYFDSNIYKRDNEFDRKYQFIPKNESLENVSPAGYVTMRDSNWLLDFSETAKQVSWFYQQEGGTNVDGVIAIDTEFFKDLLKIIGPINLVKYDLEITKNNFLEVTQQEVEKEYFKDPANKGVDEPKSILADMLPIIAARIKKTENWPHIYKFIFDELQEKHFLLYSSKSSIQSTIVKENWGGTISNSNYDYLYINNSNLGANKSSIYLYEKIEVDIHSTNGNSIHNIKIYNDYPEIDLSGLEYMNSNNSKNKNYTRILVPTDSSNISVYENGNDLGGYKTISEEAGKTKIGFWTTTEKGSNSLYEVTYEVPMDKIKNPNKIYIQKQPGAVNQTIKIIKDKEEKYNGIFDRDIFIK